MILTKKILSKSIGILVLTSIHLMLIAQESSFQGNSIPGENKDTIELYESAFSGSLFENIYINEIMTVNSMFFDEFGDADDWIELYNANSVAVNIEGIYLSDDVYEPDKWQLSEALTIDAGGFAVIWADNDSLQGPFHASFKLSSIGESLVLSQVLDQQIFEIDRLNFGKIPENISYGRKNDGTDNWILLNEPSLNSTNNESGRYQIPPTLSKSSGLYSNNLSLILSSKLPEADIYYTLDGEIPDKTSTLYSSPIPINNTTLLKLRSYKDGYAPSEIVEGFFLFDHNSDLAIFNISTDPKNLWDDSIGIYVEGTNGITQHNYNIPSNFFQEWERPALITMLEPDGSIAFVENAGISISGNGSRRYIQKSFSLHFRKEYGTKAVNYKVFKDLDITEFKHLKLRMGGQDFGSMMMRDRINHSLLHNVVDLDVMAYRPAILYLNGEYWGLYGLRESLTDDYIESHFDVDKSQIDLLNNGGYDIEAGTNTNYLDLYSFMEYNSMAFQMIYDQVAGRIDINEFINYQIAEIYYANYDWPANNQKMWRAGEDYKWRWMLYDTDASTNFDLWGETHADFNSLDFNTDPNATGWPNSAKYSLIFRHLLQNNGFKEEFVQRSCTYMALVFNQERVNSFIDSLINQIDSEMDREIEKWTQEYTGFGVGIACGGSRLAWETKINNYRDFFTDRPDHYMQFLKEKFNNYNTYSLNFTYNEDTNGKLYVNSNEFEIPYNYSAEYFSDYELKIKVIADPGYEFYRWLETGDTSSVISFTGDSTSFLTPVFKAIGTMGMFGRLKASTIQISVFPNPAKTEDIHITISGHEIGGNIKISVYNIIGEQLENRNLRGTQNNLSIVVPVRNWETGLYIIRVQSNSTQNTIKFIVE